MNEWHAIVIDGAERAVRAFVAGVLGDRGAAPDAAVFAKDVGVKPESLGERLRALLGAERHQLVLVSETLVAPLLTALAGEGAAAGLGLAEHHRVRGAHFGFSIETFSREVGKAVHEMLETLPPDVTIADRNEGAEGHDDHKGVELYAPVHDYVYRATGTVRGSFDGVRAARGRLEAIEAVVLDALHLDTAA